MATWLSANHLAAMFSSDSAREDSPEIIESGDFRIDLGSRHATVRGQQLRLSDEEFELLVYLVGHPTSIITPHTRLSTRWGRNLIHQAEVFRVLTQLRKKLESAGCPHYIRTEPWIVYRFDPRSREEVH
jgi:two-component system KDP operon response regulator KdpE